MCLVLFNHGEHPVYPLIVAANRDEFDDRPAAPAHFWDEPEGMLAGKDLKGGGTWLGMTKSGAFAALTNVRDPHTPPPSGARSRGEIIPRLLTAEMQMDQAIEHLLSERESFDQYNIIAGKPGRLYYGTNQQGGSFSEISAGTHGLSNARLDTPWPKVELGKERLAGLATDFCPIDPDVLFDILQAAEPFPDDKLPETGVGVDLERGLSPLFIRMPGYGTRCSTVILADTEGMVTFIERTYENGKPAGEERFTFQIR